MANVETLVFIPICALHKGNSEGFSELIALGFSMLPPVTFLLHTPVHLPSGTQFLGVQISKLLTVKSLP